MYNDDPADEKENKMRKEKIEGLYIKYAKSYSSEEIANVIATDLTSEVKKHECSMCFESFAIDDLYTSSCVQAHRGCFDCASRQVETQLKDNNKVCSVLGLVPFLVYF
jgi:hypothetical protein